MNTDFVELGASLAAPCSWARTAACAASGIVCSSWGMLAAPEADPGLAGPGSAPVAATDPGSGETPVVIKVRRRAGFECLLTW